MVIGMSVLVDNYVLNKGSELDCMIDLGLLLLLKVDTLCIAAALEVEDAVI